MSRPNEASDTYFYSQKNERTFHRRLRKGFDDYALFGDHKEQLLTFKSSGGDEIKESINKAKRPPSSYKRVVVSLSSGLPSIDPAGPRLVSDAAGEELREQDDEDKEEEEEGCAAIEKAEPEEDEIRRKGRAFTFAEAKFASTSVLANLSRLLGNQSALFTLPSYLVDDLLRDFDQLTCDVVVEKREWQTESSCLYPDSANASPYLTGQPEDEPTRVRQESSVEAVLRAQSSRKQLEQRNKKQQQQLKRRRKKKGVNKNMEQKSEASPSRESSPNRKPIPERPMTAMSVASNYSVRSDVSHSSSQHRAESPGRYEYDSLPAELRGTSPTILNYRREVHTVVPKMTRLEKLNAQKGTSLKPKRSHKISINTSEKLDVKKSEDNITEEPSDELNVSAKLIPIGGTLSFSISTCENEDWVVRPSEKEDIESSTLHHWDGQLARLKEAMRKREEAQVTAKLRGEDGPVIVKFYDAKSLRLKHQKATSFPLPAVLNKLPPSVASFSLPTVNETLMMGEGAKLFLLILPDGSGHCNYFSGREAVSISRSEHDRRGLHTIVYDDTDQHRMLGCFGPDGRNCCYYPSGSMQLLTSEHGGTVFDEDGHVIRNWTWPDLKYKLPVSVSIQLNSCISFHCTGLSNMVVRFSCHGQMNRFNVAPVVDIIEDLQQKDSIRGSSGGGLVYSKGNTKVQTPSLGETTSTVDGWNNSEAVKDLTIYREKIRSMVGSWMAHYRQTIGITSSPNVLPRSVMSQTCLTHSKSVLGFLPEDSHEVALSRASTRSGHAHHPTYPLSSRASSAFGMRTKSPTLDGGGEGEEERGGVVSPSIPRPISPRDYIQSPPQVQKRVPVAKAQKTGHVKKVMCGCPVALHTLLLKGLDAMPPCKCDKRKAPNIFDLEFDVFLQSHVPKQQLIVVVVLSSGIKDSCPYEPMLDDIHYSMNRMRYSPCVQCSTDPFRLFKYDLVKATKDLTCTVPLLMQRHSVSSGMCLMYVGGELVCADFMFNGYGTTRTDFMKQVQNSMEAGKRHMFLPRDYRFSNRTGSKVISSKLWAYPVTGVAEDLIPLTPESRSETNLPPLAVSQEQSPSAKNSNSHCKRSVDILQLSITSVSKHSNVSESAISVITEDVS